MLVIFTHTITVERSRAGSGKEGLGLTEFVNVDLEVTAQGKVSTQPTYDTPFGPLGFGTVVEDVEITSCLNEHGKECFAQLENDDSYEVMREAEKHLQREYEREEADA